MLRVKKAVIPAAGLGTRFLPVTKALPKEMLPIVDIPTISLIIDEALAAGIEEIIIVNNRKKKSLENYFAIDVELENDLKKNNKQALAAFVREIATKAKVTFVYQDEAKGLGHAILMAKEAVGNEPFAILLGDDIVVSPKPAIAQLIDCYHLHHGAVVGVQTIALPDVVKYGMIAKEDLDGKRTYRVLDLVEKPSVQHTPSQLAILGRYVLTPRIFSLLETQTPGKGGEIQITDAIARLAQEEAVYAYDFEGRRYDVGDRFGFVQATIDFALQRDDIGLQVQAYLESLVKK